MNEHSRLLWAANQWPAEVFHASVTLAAQSMVDQMENFMPGSGCDVQRVENYIKSELLQFAAPAGSA